MGRPRQSVCWFCFCKLISDANMGEKKKHFPLPLSSTFQATCDSIQKAVHYPPVAASFPLQAVFLVDLQISCQDIANQHCVSKARHSLDWFLHPAFLMRDISTLAQLAGSLYKNGLGWGVAQQNCPTALVQEKSAQKDWVSLSNF